MVNYSILFIQARTTVNCELSAPGDLRVVKLTKLSPPRASPLLWSFYGNKLLL